MRLYEFVIVNKYLMLTKMLTHFLLLRITYIQNHIKTTPQTAKKIPSKTLIEARRAFRIPIAVSFHVKGFQSRLQSVFGVLIFNVE